MRREADADSQWDAAAQRALGRPYLDPLVADAKRDEHLRLLDRWIAWDATPSDLLKTDLWEEAVGGDELLFTLSRRSCDAWGIDVSPRVVDLAREAAAVTVADAELRCGSVAALPFADSSFDIVLSTSTIDHLPDRQAESRAISEIARVLRPGGVAIVTADNRQNIGDWLLQAAARCGLLPFPIGPSLSLEELESMVRSAGLLPTNREHIVFGPRVVATAAVRAARVAPEPQGRRAVRRVLAAFDRAGRRWPRRLGCFVAVRAVHPGGGDALGAATTYGDP